MIDMSHFSQCIHNYKVIFHEGETMTRNETTTKEWCPFLPNPKKKKTHIERERKREKERERERERKRERESGLLL